MFSELHQKIDESNNILILIHEDPDGDAIGSGAALALGLKALGKQVCLPFSGYLQEVALCLNPLEVLESHIPANFVPTLIIILDSSSPARLGKYSKYYHLSRTKIETINIDHHASNEYFASINIVNVDTSSTCEIIATYMIEYGYEITTSIASFLLGGIVSDTGRFAYKNTSSRTLSLAAQLVSHGANLAQIVQSLESKISYESMQVWGRALSNIRRSNNGQVVWTSVPTDSFTSANDSPQQMRELVAFLRRAKNARLAFLCQEKEVGTIYISFRSNGEVDCSAIAKEFSGSGHIGAAGCKIDGQLEDASKKILSHIAKANLL